TVGAPAPSVAAGELRCEVVAATTASGPATPAACSAMFSAAVPLDTATAWRALCAAANASSKRPLYGPRVSAPLARISAIAAAISPPSPGGEKTPAAGAPQPQAPSPPFA